MSRLAAENLLVRYWPRTVLEGLDLVFAPGQVTAVVGPNGAGKSTLLACLAGLIRPAAGQARIGDAAVLALSARQRARRIGYLPQTPEIAWAVDVATLVGLGRTAFLGVGGPTAEDRAAVARALARTGSEAFARRPVTELSGGERARVLLARALAGEPEWLLADEPMAGLDLSHQLEACALFQRLAHDEGRGVVATLHDLSLALRFADRVVVMAEGRVLADGAPAEALAAETVARAYGVRTRLIKGESGPLLEVVGPSDRPGSVSPS